MEQHKPVANIEKKKEAFARALGVMQTLRQDCPWDAKQNNESIRQNSIEEMFELADALMKGDDKEIQKECGDVLEQIFFYAMFAEEKGAFDMADICNAMCDKLVYRHPHVFNPDGSLVSECGCQSELPGMKGKTSLSSEEVSVLWEVVKQKEKDGNETILSGIPASLPSLVKAYRIQDKARNAGFDWEKKEDVWQKVKEEIKEFEAEVSNMDHEKMEHEFGDLLFSLINAARLYKIKPDNALEHTNQKFINRFTYVEMKAREQGKLLNEMTLQEMDALWDEAKHKLKQ
ncbi:MAG: nucleoside triphosphate pyrophosphohydrolase [Bacteroidales bacterium]|nr:nucleoside triphosphate pyrophosphohydrolase [Bacteroidales bacterium]